MFFSFFELLFINLLFLSSSLILLFHSSQIFHINQHFLFCIDPTITFYMFLLLLSLGALPPFLEFLPKWIVIQYLTNTAQLFLVVLMVVTTLITLFYYLRLTFTTFLFSYQEPNWNSITVYNNSTYILLLILPSMSTLALLICVGVPTIFYMK